ncbi:very short patch repair endonuclease [Brachybacterium sp.]|uniref:very short patch repair endonuclease n=1 Tax=Brachybacterium sp. TaxID=1891286 RepID=UPI002ED642CB
MSRKSPKASSENARRTMRANKRKDTSIELAIRRRLHASGLRYRVDHPADASDRRRRADIVFTRARIAIFIDGCFWHGCSEHYVEPRANSEYWRPKIARNRERDLDSTRRLQEAGWKVMRFWEHEDPDLVAAEISTAVRSRDEKKSPSV